MNFWDFPFGIWWHHVSLKDDQRGSLNGQLTHTAQFTQSLAKWIAEPHTLPDISVSPSTWRAIA